MGRKGKRLNPQRWQTWKTRKHPFPQAFPWQDNVRLDFNCTQSLILVLKLYTAYALSCEPLRFGTTKIPLEFQQMAAYHVTFKVKVWNWLLLKIMRNSALRMYYPAITAILLRPGLLHGDRIIISWITSDLWKALRAAAMFIPFHWFSNFK